ncbi:MAG: ribonuclease HI [Gammaproteobacteria bacterium WSBS_2016_MAG_OTU1]
MNTKVIIYTDGACKGNPGPGGWGVLLQWGDKQKELFGGEVHTTNNRMEMMAAIMALESLKRNCDVVLHTDSKYVKMGLTEWLPKWRQADGELRRRGGEIKNKDLWERLAAAAARHNVEWQWVKGHADNAGNICADKLANCGAKQAIKQETT